MTWDDVEAALRLGLYGIIGTVAAYVVSFIQVRKQALDQQIKRNAVDDAVAAIDERNRHERVTNKIDDAQRIADSSTPPRIAVTPADIQAGVARRRASLVSSSMLPPAGDEVSVDLGSMRSPGVPADWRDEVTRPETPRGKP